MPAIPRASVWQAACFAPVMAIAGYAQGIETSFLATMNARALAAREAKAADPIQTVSVTPAAATQSAQASDSGSFLDEVLDVINPLQHLPVVGTLYRAITGDKIGDVAQVAGDTLYGGVIGLGSSVANLIFKDATGKDFGDTVLAFVEGLGSDAPPALADAKPAPVKVADATAPQAPHAAPPPAATAKAAPRQPAPGQMARTTPAAPPSDPARVVPAQARMLADPAAFMAMLQAKGIDPALGMRAMQAYQKTLGLDHP